MTVAEPRRLPEAFRLPPADTTVSQFGNNYSCCRIVEAHHGAKGGCFLQNSPSDIVNTSSYKVILHPSDRLISFLRWLCSARKVPILMSFKFHIANDGTLFIDNVSNLSRDQQGKLLPLRLMPQVMRRSWSSVDGIVNVCVISATNQDLLFFVVEERFREDLYECIDTEQFDSPPLCERKEDSLLLPVHFILKNRPLFARRVSIKKKWRRLLTPLLSTITQFRGRCHVE
jgi:hypothetical protein